jgi:hypothetical protein
MSKISPWHSTRSTDPPVYHDESTCTEGNNIEPKYRAAGTGGRRKCERCQKISG